MQIEEIEIRTRKVKRVASENASLAMGSININSVDRAFKLEAIVKGAKTKIVYVLTAKELYDLFHALQEHENVREITAQVGRGSE